MIEALLDASKAQGCYKVILDCSEANAPFYEKCGLTRKEVQMVSMGMGEVRVWIPGVRPRCETEV